MKWIAVALFTFGCNTVSLHAQQSRMDSATPGRAALEQRFRERFGEVVKSRLSLSDGQMKQLTDVNRRFETRRRDLFQQERSVRREMRDVLTAGTEDQATQDRVARLLEQALKVQRQRLDLLEEEDRALVTFLTPVQRAKYFGMQEQMRRRIDDMRRGAEGDSLRPMGPRGMRRRPGGFARSQD
ncbi:MAG: Spy/CpxP family protein refolding chaperone [Gemmatimonadaceae bacterium]